MDENKKKSKNKKASFRPSDAKKSYNPKEFIVPPGDASGHSTRLQFRCSPAYGRRLDVIIHSRRFPYNTPSDILRHALHRHLDYLSQIEPKIPLDMPSLTIVNNLFTTQQEMLRFLESSKSLSKIVYDLLGSGAQAEARRIVSSTLCELERMEKSHWRDSYIEEVKKHFGHLLEEDNG